jgi:hypothetical protein
MADIIGELAAKSGISPDLAGKGVGAVLGVLKDKLPANAFSQVQAAVPNANALMEDAQSASGDGGGGVLGAVTGALGKLTGGGGGAAALMNKFTQLGFSPDQLQKFLPNVIEFLKSKLPADVISKVGALLPGAGQGG